jgi:hypothetical protein
MADENGKVILWSAGVSATSAALAGLLAQRATTPLSKNPWFILCAAIACFSFAVLLFAGLYAVCDWWRDRIRRKASSVAAEHPAPEAPAVSADDLTVNFDKQAKHVVEGKAVILEIDYSVANNSDAVRLSIVPPATPYSCMSVRLDGTGRRGGRLSGVPVQPRERRPSRRMLGRPAAGPHGSRRSHCGHYGHSRTACGVKRADGRFGRG